MRFFYFPIRFLFIDSFAIILSMCLFHMVTPRNFMLSTFGGIILPDSILMGSSAGSGQKVIVNVLLKFSDRLFALNQFSRFLKSCCRM